MFDAAVATLRAVGLEVREYPTTRAQTTDPAGDAKRRADDLMQAVCDPEVAGVFLSIDGPQTLRLLPHLDLQSIADHPKVLCGSGDATGLLLAWQKAGVVPFYGPMLMAGLAQAAHYPASFLDTFRSVLFHGDSTDYPAFPWHSTAYGAWGGAGADPTRLGTKYTTTAPFDVHRGAGTVRGPVIGGSLPGLVDTLGTAVAPARGDYVGAWIFLDLAGTREPNLQRDLSRLGVQGVFERATGVLVARPLEHRPPFITRIRDAVIEAVRAYGDPNLPVVFDVDCGHTNPKLVLPLGVGLRVDLDGARWGLTEAAVSKP